MRRNRERWAETGQHNTIKSTEPPLSGAPTPDIAFSSGDRSFLQKATGRKKGFSVGAFKQIRRQKAAKAHSSTYDLRLHQNTASKYTSLSAYPTVIISKRDNVIYLQIKQESKQ